MSKILYCCESKLEERDGEKGFKVKGSWNIEKHCQQEKFGILDVLE